MLTPIQASMVRQWVTTVTIQADCPPKTEILGPSFPSVEVNLRSHKGEEQIGLVELEQYSQERGVYIIHNKDQILYVGKTFADFRIRLLNTLLKSRSSSQGNSGPGSKTHQRLSKHVANGEKLYVCFLTEAQVLARVHASAPLTPKEIIGAMEVALIQLYDPNCNINKPKVYKIIRVPPIRRVHTSRHAP